jgi:hypothetical protein
VKKQYLSRQPPSSSVIYISSATRTSLFSDSELGATLARSARLAMLFVVKVSLLKVRVHSRGHGPLHDDDDDIQTPGIMQYRD